MKRLFFSLVLIAALSGCVVLPYDEPYTVYPGTPVHAHHYSTAPSLYSPYGPPVYIGPPAYVGPPIRFSFGLNYRSGGKGHHGHHHRHGFKRHGDRRGHGGHRR